MKAVVCTKYGAPEVLVLKNVINPKPKEKEVLIKIYATAVTTAGIIGRRGKPYIGRLVGGLTKPKNRILGMELAGKIEKVGSQVSRFKIGNRIFGLAGLDLGAYAEYICLPEDAIIAEMPNDLSWEQAAAVVEGGLTALNYLCDKVQIKDGQKVLINGASGSVGTAAVQLAKYFGAEVTGVCSTGNFEKVMSLGADSVMDYTKKDFTENKNYFDIVFDTVGKRSFLECRSALKTKGVYLDTTGIGTMFHMVWTSVFGSRKAILSPTYLRPPQKLKRDLAFLKELVTRNAIEAVIDKVYPLEQVVEANTYVEAGHKTGNVILTIK